MIRMTVREGGTVRTVRLDGVRAEIGSGVAAAVRLSGAGISARHCVIRGLRRGFEVLDQASREGTILNGTRVSRAPLRPGDTLTVGSASVVLEEADLDHGGRAAPVPAGPVPALVPRAAPPAEDPFEIQFYRAVRKSPPLLASLAVHAAGALLALALAPADAAPPPRTGSIFLARVPAVETEAEEPADLPSAPDSLPSPLPVPDPPPAAVEPQPLPPLEVPPPEPPPLPPRDEAPSPDDVIGIPGPGKKEPPARPPEIRDNPEFHGTGAGDANRAAAGFVLDSLGAAGSGDRALLRKLDPRRVLVVRGSYDRVEDTLAVLGIRHETLGPDEVALVPLPPEAILIVDCDHDPLEPRAVRAVREFVQAGGFLCTTDYGLEHVIEPAFPGMLRSLARGGLGVSTQNEVVPMRVAAKDHPLVRGIRAGGNEDVRWWVEDSAYPIEVLDRGRVTVLAESAEFQKRYRSGVLAATFPWGKGRVLHLLGHAWQKEGNLKGTYALQRMVVNFLLARAETLPK